MSSRVATPMTMSAFELKQARYKNWNWRQASVFILACVWSALYSTTLWATFMQAHVMSGSRMEPLIRDGDIVVTMTPRTMAFLGSPLAVGDLVVFDTCLVSRNKATTLEEEGSILRQVTELREDGCFSTQGKTPTKYLDELLIPPTAIVGKVGFHLVFLRRFMLSYWFESKEFEEQIPGLRSILTLQLLILIPLMYRWVEIVFCHSRKSIREASAPGPLNDVGWPLFVVLCNLSLLGCAQDPLLGYPQQLMYLFMFITTWLYSLRKVNWAGAPVVFGRTS